MSWFPPPLMLLLSATLSVAGDLPSRTLDLPPVSVPQELINFDLLDLRRDPGTRTTETEPHSAFGIKQHVGVAVGYDNDAFHGSVGFYVTVAEWGRWNFGIPSPEVGFERYPAYDPRARRTVTKDDAGIFISLASAHYRVGKVRSSGGLNWYLNLEQIFDMRRNVMGSQIGLTVSAK